MELKLLKEQSMRMGAVPGGSWLAGVSGGADSVALFYLLLNLHREGEIHLQVVHVNHGLRGTESDEDEAFTRALCRREGIPFHVFHPHLDGTDENSARLARYACFRRCMMETGAQGLVLAHHRDDLAETFLLHLLRGAGPEGLSGLKSEGEVLGVRVLRPLLDFSRQELRELLAEQGIPWREDSSNSDCRYKRNEIRQELLPCMERIFPGCTRRIAQASELIRLQQQQTETAAEQFWKQEGGAEIPLEALQSLQDATLSQVLRRWAEQDEKYRKQRGLDFAQTRQVLELIRSGRNGQVNLPGGRWACVKQGVLFFITPDDIPMKEVCWKRENLTFGEFVLHPESPSGQPGDGKRSQEFSLQDLEGTVIRTRRTGDRIRPFGMSGSKKLQDYLTDRHIAAPWRDRIPLLCRESEVLWVAGVGAGGIKPRSETQTAAADDRVLLSWEGPMPWLKE